jgi:hypothetical protein
MNMFKSTTAKDPDEYISFINEGVREDIVALDILIRKIAPQFDRKLFGSIIGYGSKSYASKSGRSGEWFTIGLARQKNYISLYINVVEESEYLPEKYTHLFPKATIGKSCVRFKKLQDIDQSELVFLITKAVDLTNSQGQV